ncbi:MAG: hypothetical protein HUK40_24040 [Desulfobacter sp.]|nr:hypothetical protein [Desulfobacter sp.]WDP86823.1 MAG: hypothetical protein HUN05_18240 [Desulfobacter sp.]
MTETIFEFLTQIGFLHPVHPAFTHIPMGMVMGAVVFRFCAVVPRLKILARTGYHCLILGLLGIVPTVFTGYLDWQHKYQGQWETLIIVKMVLAALLAILMIFIAVKDDPENPGFNKMTGFYFLLILLAVGLGFSGGELVFG